MDGTIDSPWPDGKANHTFKMLLDRQRMSSATKQELVTFLQILRILNSLRSLVKLQVKLKSNPDHLESFKDSVELHFLTAATYYEGLRTYLDTIHPKVNPDYVSKDTTLALRNLKRRLDKKDGFLGSADLIRNQVVFHFDSEVIDGFITDETPAEDILIGYAKGPHVGDTTYVEPYSCVFSYLADRLPSHVDKLKMVDWIMENSLREASEFCRILERIANGFFKRFGKLVEISAKEAFEFTHKDEEIKR